MKSKNTNQILGPEYDEQVQRVGAVTPARLVARRMMEQVKARRDLTTREKIRLIATNWNAMMAGQHQPRA